MRKLGAIIFVYTLTWFSFSCQAPKNDKTEVLSLTKEKTIQSFIDLNGEEFFFVEITDMAKVGDEYIFIDGARKVAYSSDKNFENVKTMTSTGTGPGEFFSIGSISNINPENHHFTINDPRYTRFMIFDKKKEFVKELKIERTIDPSYHNVSFEEDKIVFVPSRLRNKTDFKFSVLNAKNQKLESFQIPDTQDIKGEGFATFQVDERYLFIAKETYPSYIITTIDGKLLKIGDLTEDPVLAENVILAEELLKSIALPSSIVLFENIYFFNDKIYILANILFKNGDYKSNRVLELELGKENDLRIKKDYHLGENDHYRAIMVDENKIIASNKRTGYLDIFEIPN